MNEHLDSSPRPPDGTGLTRRRRLRYPRSSVERFIATRQVGGAASQTALLDTVIDAESSPAVVTLSLAGPPDREPTRTDMSQGARSIADALGRRMVVRYQYTPVFAAGAVPSEGRRSSADDG